jgi:tetratricopeptide (TPR) repeat protein
MGGQGKTQIALEYCRRAKDRTGTAVLWVDASSESTLMQSYSSFSESFASLEGVPQDVNARVKFTIRKLRAWQNPWLIVFDNYDSPAEFNNVEDYMPENDKGMILITTRHADADRLAVEDDQIQLPGLSESEAVELLLKQSQRKLMSDSSLNSGRMIVSRLGYHALAIAQAGAYINKRKLPLEEFLNHFERRKDTILKDTTPQMSQYRRKLGQAEKETSLSVFTTWELSYRQLFAEDTEDKCVADLLTLFAFFDPSGISEGLFRAYCDNPRKTETASDDSGSSNATLDDQEPACSQRFFDGNEYQVPGAFLALHEERWDSDYYCDALAIMAQLSLVEGFTRTSDGLHKVTLHPLVRDWIRLRTQKSSCAAYTYLAATCIDRLLLSRRIKDFFMIDWSTIQELLSHLEAYMKNLEDFFPQHSALLYRYKRFHFEEYDLDFGDLYLQSGQYGKGKEIYKRCLARRENKDAANDSITRVIFRRLSNAHSYLGEYKEAEDLARKGLNSVLEAKGIENAETFDQMNLLVATLLNQDLNEEAEELIRTSLKLREKLHGTDDYNIAHSLANLGRIYYRQQKYMEAEEIFRQALSLQEALLGKEHRATRNTMHNVANCLNVLGGAENWKGAEELYHLILETGERTLGKDHPQQIYTQLNLAKLLVKMDRNEEAEEIYNRAMKLLEVSLGKSHPRTLDCATNYGALLCVTGRYEDALPLLERAFEETRELLGLEHPKTIYREMRLKDLLKEMAYHTNSIR